MDVLQATQDLVQEVADVIVAEVLRLQQLVQIGLHQVLYDVAGDLASQGCVICSLDSLTSCRKILSLIPKIVCLDERES